MSACVRACVRACVLRTQEELTIVDLGISSLSHRKASKLVRGGRGAGGIRCSRGEEAVREGRRNHSKGYDPLIPHERISPSAS